MVLLLAAAGESPKGDSFDVDYVAHEAGHQFNIEHTWSGKRGGCSKGQFATSFDASSQAAMELGAGTTMATYAGICGADDLQPNASPYFHVFSLHEFEVGIAASSLELASPARDPGEPSRRAPHPPPSLLRTSAPWQSKFKQSASFASCGTEETLTSSRPTAITGQTCTIPRKTPYTLIGMGSDADNDAMTFTWEQIDPSPEQVRERGHRHPA